MQNTTPAGSRPWVRRVDFWIVLVTIAAVLPMGFVSIGFQVEYSRAKELFQGLESQVSANSLLMQEKEALVKRIQERDTTLKVKIERANRALYHSRCEESAQFPVKSGEFVVLQRYEYDDGVDTFFYLPPGKHSLDLTISLATSTNPSPLPRGRLSESERKTFQIVGGQRGVLRTSLKNGNGKCWVTSTLYDVHGNQLDQFRVPFMERTEKFRLAGESAGGHYYMPGDDYDWDVPFYQVSNFLLRPMGETDQFQIVKVRVELGGNLEKEFVRIENVATYLQRAQFAYAFEPEVVDGKLILTDVGKKFFQQESWMRPRLNGQCP